VTTDHLAHRAGLPARRLFPAGISASQWLATVLLAAAAVVLTMATGPQRHLGGRQLLLPLLACVLVVVLRRWPLLVLGVATGAAGGGGGGPGQALISTRGALGLPPMPTWAMISVIIGWIVGWSGIGAWRMMTRDA
jgi:hypothetical protein